MTGKILNVIIYGNNIFHDWYHIWWESCGVSSYDITMPPTKNISPPAPLPAISPSPPHPGPTTPTSHPLHHYHHHLPNTAVAMTLPWRKCSKEDQQADILDSFETRNINPLGRTNHSIRLRTHDLYGWRQWAWHGCKFSCYWPYLNRSL